MTVGTGIFLASLVLGIILLFSITKDRWNWAKGFKRLGLVSLGLVAVTVAAFYGWNAHQEANEAAKAKLAQARDARARTCIAGDLPRMENLARSIDSAVREDMKLEDVKAAVDSLTRRDGHIVPPKNNIKERVLIYELPTL